MEAHSCRCSFLSPNVVFVNQIKVFALTWAGSTALCRLAAHKYTPLSFDVTLVIDSFEYFLPFPSKLIFPFTSSSGYRNPKFRYPRYFSALCSSCLYQRMCSKLSMLCEQLSSLTTDSPARLVMNDGVWRTLSALETPVGEKRTH